MYYFAVIVFFPGQYNPKVTKEMRIQSFEEYRQQRQWGFHTEKPGIFLIEKTFDPE